MTDPLTSADDRRKHLEFIQAVITRMSAASSSAKSWLLPVVTATYGYTLTKHADSVAALGICAVTLFAFLDANYLNQERAYRQLYADVANGQNTVPTFSLAVAATHPTHSNTDDVLKRQLLTKLWRSLKSWIPQRCVWSSWSVGPFYGALLLLGAAIMIKVR